MDGLTPVSDEQHKWSSVGNFKTDSRVLDGGEYIKYIACVYVCIKFSKNLKDIFKNTSVQPLPQKFFPWCLRLVLVTHMHQILPTNIKWDSINMYVLHFMCQLKV